MCCTGEIPTASRRISATAPLPVNLQESRGTKQDYQKRYEHFTTFLTNLQATTAWLRIRRKTMVTTKEANETPKKCHFTVAQDELTLLWGVSGEITNLEDKLRSLRDYLADAERRRITDKSVQGWVRKLKDVMYDATDILDLCHLKAFGRSQQVDVGCLNPLLFCLRNPVFAHDIGSRIKALNARLDAICKSAKAFSFLKLEAYEDMAAPRRSSTADRKTDPVLDRSGVVGEKIEEDTRALVKRLTNIKPAMNITVVAVVGTGGIGKTTLAKKVFNDEAIQERFDKKIWLSVTQEVNDVELLKTAIKSVGGRGAGDSNNKSLLVPALVDAIRGKSFFLVLDDVWEEERAWHGLLKAPFSHGAAGSRVVVTTRHDTVARGMQAVYPFHHVDKLSPQDAWNCPLKMPGSVK
uniref:NB-ARC domain-containing protein n=1 Tax=Leersia perrieri TaxID=77586 RepID=A0A0D9XVQ0_9ORYZ